MGFFHGGHLIKEQLCLYFETENKPKSIPRRNLKTVSKQLNLPPILATIDADPIALFLITVGYNSAVYR